MLKPPLAASCSCRSNLTLIEQNKIGEEMIIVVKGMTREVEELRREVRALSDKMRG